MRFHPRGESGRQPLRTVDVLGKEQEPSPVFSAASVLDSHAAAFKQDLRITNLGRSTEAVLQAQLAVLFPGRVTSIIDKPRFLFPQNVQEVTRLDVGAHLFLLAQQFPQTQEVIKQVYPARILLEHAGDALRPGLRPQVWPFVLGRLLYPDAGTWTLTEGDVEAHLSKIREWLDDEPTTEEAMRALRNGAHLALLQPELRSKLQPLFLSLLRKHEQMVGNIFGNTVECVDMAFNLEIIYGDTIQGLEPNGSLKVKEKVISRGTGLPDRLLA